MVLLSHLLRIYQGGQILGSCLLRERSRVALITHHLVPRVVHGKGSERQRKRPKKIGRLCQACHDFVHRIASPETLAKDYLEYQAITEEDRHSAVCKDGRQAQQLKIETPRAGDCTMNELRGRNRQLTKANVFLRLVNFTKQRDIYQLQDAHRPR